MTCILESVLRRFRAPRRETFAERQLPTVQSSLEATRRELALFASDMVGAQSYLGQFDQIRLDRAERRQMRDLIEQTATPYMLIDPRPGLHIIDATKSYAAATLTDRYRIAGDKLFDTFPDNPDQMDADGVSNLYDSIQKAAQSGQAHTMAIQRYDVRDAAGHFVTRYWRPINIPVLDDAGRLLYVLHDAGELDVEDVPSIAGRSRLPA